MKFFNKIKNYPFWPVIRQHRKRYALGLASLFFVDIINVLLPLVMKEAIDALIPKNFTRIWIAGLAYFGLMAIQSWGRYLWRIYLIGTSHLVASEQREKLYSHLQRLPLPYYQKVRTGDLMSRATNDIESYRMALGPGILVAVDAVLMFALIVPVMFSLSWKLSLLAFAFYPLVPWLTARLGDKIDTLFETAQIRMSRISSFTQETFAGIRLIKSLVLENRVHQKFVKLSEGYRAQGLILAKYQAIFSPLLSFITQLGTFLILLLGGLDVMEGLITVGTFVAFQRFVVQLSWPMEAIGWAVTMTREGAAAHRRIQEVLLAPEAPLQLTSSHPFSERPVLFEIKSLQFSHGEGFQLDLNHLEIERGKKIGVVGGVAAGKSTLFHLMTRLYQPPSGSLYFEQRDINTIPVSELRKRIGGVEQQVFLFSESIRTNATLGMDWDPEEGQVVEALKVAGVYDEMDSLQGGIGTLLGERGVNLSGGQKQRLALARALVRKPELLILDDCFSAVDVAVERKIIEFFFDKYPYLSVCFASHRLSVMPHMDELWVLERGRLVGKGTHDELIRTNSLYQQMWKKSEQRTRLEKLDLMENETT